MKRKHIALFFGNVYETKELVDLQNDVGSSLELLWEEEYNVVDIKTCLNTNNEALITVIYEEEEEDN